MSIRYFTTREAGEIIGEPEWLVRRIVDGLDEPVQRFGNKRLIPDYLVPKIKQAIEQRERDREDRQRDRSEFEKAVGI